MYLLTWLTVDNMLVVGAQSQSYAFIRGRAFVNKTQKQNGCHCPIKLNTKTFIDDTKHENKKNYINMSFITINKKRLSGTLTPMLSCFYKMQLFTILLSEPATCPYAPCQHAGTCIDNPVVGGKITCKCKRGYAGDYCESRWTGLRTSL